MNQIIETKFQIGRNLSFAFIDSWAKHPSNLDDLYQQAAFEREASILWQAATSTEEFVFKSIQDILVWRLSKKTKTTKKGEQTYCRKQVSDKTPKVVLLHFADFFWKNNTLVQNVENWDIALKYPF